MGKQLYCYKEMPVWNHVSLPQAFQEKHNTKEGTWAKLTLLKGDLVLAMLDADGQVLSTHHFSTQDQPPFIEPQAWHRIVSFSEDMVCQLAFYCQAKDYYHKKYERTQTHSEVIAAVEAIRQDNTPIHQVLDLGCGVGRNALYLDLLGLDVTALDHNSQSIARLSEIARCEQRHLTSAVYDINLAQLTHDYDLIISTVVLMFLQRERIPTIIQNMQEHTRPKGYNLIVCAMDTQDYPCNMPFSFTFKTGELSRYYANWRILKYNENPGALHKTDANGNRIVLIFATLLAQKTQ